MRGRVADLAGRAVRIAHAADAKSVRSQREIANFMSDGRIAPVVRGASRNALGGSGVVAADGAVGAVGVAEARDAGSIRSGVRIANGSGGTAGLVAIAAAAPSAA